MHICTLHLVLVTLVCWSRRMYLALHCESFSERNHKQPRLVLVTPVCLTFSRRWDQQGICKILSPVGDECHAGVDASQCSWQQSSCLSGKHCQYKRGVCKFLQKTSTMLSCHMTWTISVDTDGELILKIHIMVLLPPS